MSSAPEALGMNGVTIVNDKVVASLNPKIVTGTSVKGGGRGLYAREPIAKGEWIWKEMAGLESIPRSWEFIAALPEASRNIYLHFAYCECRLVLSLSSSFVVSADFALKTCQVYVIIAFVVFSFRMSCDRPLLL